MYVFKMLVFDSIILILLFGLCLLASESKMIIYLDGKICTITRIEECIEENKNTNFH